MATAAAEMREYVAGRRRMRLREIWTTWRITTMVAVRDMRVKYKQAALGPLWLILAPMGLLAAVTIAFSGVTDVNTGDVPYVLFALTGLICWTYIQLCLSQSPAILITNSSLVRRSTCPRLALVQGSMLANLPPVAVMLLAAIAGAAIWNGLVVQILLLPVMFVWLVVLAWGLSLLLAALAARARDIVAIVPLIVQAGLFVTPVGYPVDGAPPHIQTLLKLNPATGVIEGWRWCILGTPPQGTAMAISLGVTIAMAWIGWAVFTRAELRLADYV